MRNWSRVFIFGILALGLVLIPGKLCAAEPINLNPINNISAEINIKDDGLAEISETISYMQMSRLNIQVRLRDIRNLEVQYDGQPLKKSQYKVKKDGNFLRIVSDSNIAGSVWKISYATYKGLSLTKDEEIFRWEIIAKPETTVQSIEATLTSPFSLDKIKHFRVFAYHGVSSSNAEKGDNQKVKFSGYYLGDQAGFTVMASWPRGTFNFSWIRRLIYNLTTAELTFWIIFGLILPTIAFCLLIIMWWRKKKELNYRPSSEMSEHPPNNIPSMVIGVLFDKKIYAHTLLSAVIDLCQRGYLVILKEANGNYIIGKRKKPDQNIRLWERQLLEEIFANDPLWTGEHDVERRSKNQLFSPRIMTIYEAVYNSVTDLGYFSENPHWVRIKYKVVGIMLYLAAVIGMIWVGVTLQPPFLLIPLGGVLAATIVIVRMAPMMPMQSKKGVEVMEVWTPFKNFIQDEKSLPAQYSVSGIFYEYLPYAVALKAEEKWMKRFRNYHMIMPEWYMTSERVQAEEAMEEIIKAIKQLSKSLSQLRGPAVS